MKRKSAEKDDSPEESTTKSEVVQLLTEAVALTSECKQIIAKMDNIRNTHALETVDLIVLTGEYSHPIFYVIPTEAITERDVFLFSFATKCRTPECNLFLCRDQVEFPEDNKEEKKRKAKLRQEWKVWGSCEKKPNQQHKYPKTRAEAEANEILFDECCDFFDKEKNGKFCQYSKSLKNMNNFTVRSTYTWCNSI